MRVHNEPTLHEEAEGVLRIGAGAETDWFVDPGTGKVTASAPAVLDTAPEGDFVLAARVRAELAETFDAGALVVWGDERNWAKLAVERSPAGVPMVVSVVTRGVSDDCNSHVLAEAAAWLRIARIGDAYAFHASLDGAWWDLIRHFRLDIARVEAGFEAQSPLGAGCIATFSERSLDPRTVADLRNGE
ncbi:MAG TPA: DUF1349 domain-containing protein [Gaiellaceae bacterium]|jgi:hypothetical protein|nr:DUF1349 domain-containing protein [Gaiellaceae bacterium]